MALTPSELIADAQLLAMPYLSEYGTAPGPLLRMLTSLEQELVTLFQTSAPERLTASGSITIVLATNSAGYALTSGSSYRDFRYQDKEGFVWEQPLAIVPDNRFDSPGVHPAGIVRGSTFFPCDPLGKRWAGTASRDFFSGEGEKVLYRYLPNAVRVTLLTQTLVAPDECRDYLQRALTAYLLTTYPGVPPERIQLAYANAGRAKSDLQLAAAKRTGSSWRSGE